MFCNYARMRFIAFLISVHNLQMVIINKTLQNLNITCNKILEVSVRHDARTWCIACITLLSSLCGNSAFAGYCLSRRYCRYRNGLFPHLCRLSLPTLISDLHCYKCALFSLSYHILYIRLVANSYNTVWRRTRLYWTLTYVWQRLARRASTVSIKQSKTIRTGEGRDSYSTVMYIIFVCVDYCLSVHVYGIIWCLLAI